MEHQMNNRTKSIGKVHKKDLAIYRYTIRMNEENNTRFLKLFERSGMNTKTNFIIARIFNSEFKVLKIDKNAVDYYTRLTNFYSQFRAIGVNYNQIVKALNSNFTEKKALAFLFKLEQETKKLVELSQKIITLTKEFESKYLNNQ